MVLVSEHKPTAPHFAKCGVPLRGESSTMTPAKWAFHRLIGMILVKIKDSLFERQIRQITRTKIDYMGHIIRSILHAPCPSPHLARSLPLGTIVYLSEPLIIILCMWMNEIEALATLLVMILNQQRNATYFQQRCPLASNKPSKL